MLDVAEIRIGHNCLIGLSKKGVHRMMHPFFYRIQFHYLTTIFLCWLM